MVLSSKKGKGNYFLKGSNDIGILLLHGWSSPPDELFPMAQYFNSFGYTVLVPTFRGHGTRPEDLLGVTRRDWLEDAKSALAELKKHSSRIFVGGISMGGNLAMLLAEDKSVAGIMPMGAAMKYKFHSIVKIALFLLGLTKTYRRKYYPPWARKRMRKRKVYLYYPIESAKEVQRLADETRKFLPRVAKPILIMQSTTDYLVSRCSPKIIFNSVKSKVKEIFWVKNVYHVFAGEKKVWEKIGEFMDKILNSKP